MHAHLQYSAAFPTVKMHLWDRRILLAFKLFGCFPLNIPRNDTKTAPKFTLKSLAWTAFVATLKLLCVQALSTFLLYLFNRVDINKNSIQVKISQAVITLRLSSISIAYAAWLYKSKHFLGCLQSLGNFDKASGFGCSSYLLTGLKSWRVWILLFVSGIAGTLEALVVYQLIQDAVYFGPRRFPAIYNCYPIWLASLTSSDDMAGVMAGLLIMLMEIGNVIGLLGNAALGYAFRTRLNWVIEVVENYGTKRMELGSQDGKMSHEEGKKLRQLKVLVLGLDEIYKAFRMSADVIALVHTMASTVTVCLLVVYLDTFVQLSFVSVRLVNRLLLTLVGLAALKIITFTSFGHMLKDGVSCFAHYTFIMVIEWLLSVRNF